MKHASEMHIKTMEQLRKDRRALQDREAARQRQAVDIAARGKGQREAHDQAQERLKAKLQEYRATAAMAQAADARRLAAKQLAAKEKQDALMATAVRARRKEALATLQHQVLLMVAAFVVACVVTLWDSVDVWAALPGCSVVEPPPALLSWFKSPWSLLATAGCFASACAVAGVFLVLAVLAVYWPTIGGLLFAAAVAGSASVALRPQMAVLRRAAPWAVAPFIVNVVMYGRATTAANLRGVGASPWMALAWPVVNVAVAVAAAWVGVQQAAG